MSFTRFEAMITPGTDVITYAPPTTAIAIRDAAGSVVARLTDKDSWATTLPLGTYSVAVTLSRPGRAPRGYCATKVRTSAVRVALAAVVVGRGDRCALYGSTGTARVRVPDVAGLAPEEASCVLRATGLRMRLFGSHGGLGHGCPPGAYKADIVIAVQRPPAGRLVKRGTRVRIGIDCVDLPGGCRSTTVPRP